MITVQQIQNTNAYENLRDKTTQSIIVQKSSRERITLGVQMSKNVGFEKWIETYNPDTKTKNVVSELIINNQ
jgi:hypothetical protein